MLKRRRPKIIGALPSKWHWFERFVFFWVGIVKINGVPQGVDPRICTTPRETKVGNIFDENDLETQDIPTSPKIQILIWRWACTSNF
jgi:hypothetical protein